MISTGLIWPLHLLSIHSARLEIRLPSPSEIIALAEMAGAEPWNPSVPFLAVRADTPVERARRLVQNHWSSLGSWRPDNWSLQLAAFTGGRPIGMANIRASDFQVTREFTTGIWVGRSHGGAGYGTELSGASLDLGFDGLGARNATWLSRSDNTASLRVAEKLGYQPDGISLKAEDNEAVEFRRFRLTAAGRADRSPGDAVSIDGLAGLAGFFGIG